MHTFLLSTFLIAAGLFPAVAADFFRIEPVKFLNKAPRDGVGVWSASNAGDEEFHPCLEVSVKTGEDTRSDQMLAKAYFFDGGGKVIATASRPSASGRRTAKERFAMPVLFHKNQPVRLYFAIPEEIRQQKWKAVVVVGDDQGAAAAAYPSTESYFLLEFPEKKLVTDRSARRVERKAAMDPLIEHVVKTRNPKMPQITLFLRAPKGVDDPGEVQGVMAICVLASGVEALRRQLQMEEMPGDYRGLLGFANANKLAIIAWGSRKLWDPRTNYDEFARAQAKEIDDSFDTVADAWERGVKELGETYGLPGKNFLLWGASGSAQWAMRLCLRKPDYFLAIHINIPSSFDRPTPEAAKVLWCLTTGEVEAGYENSRRFVAECRRLGYPMVYKAIIGLGHEGHADASALGFEFFKLALTQKELRAEHDREMSEQFSRVSVAAAEGGQPWPEIFRNPPFHGDMDRQEVFSADDMEQVPEEARIALPTEELANIWARWP